MAETEKVIAPAEQEGTAELEAPVIEAPKDPYDTEVLNSITKFFRSRAKNPAKFTFDTDGNLEIKDPNGTIQLKRFMPLEPSDRAALEEYRLETLADLDEKYEAERVVLVAAWEQFHTTGAMRPVLAANQRVAELDARRSAIRTAVRNIVFIENPQTNEVVLTDRYEERKMFGAKDPFGRVAERMVQFGQTGEVAKKLKNDPFDKLMYRLCFYDFKPEHDQGKYVADEDAAPTEEGGEGDEPSEMLFRQTLKDGRKARIFFDTDSDVNGFLSPMWPVDFTMGDTRYCMAMQAYEAERAKELGMDELRNSILKTRSARTIRLMTRKVTAHPADAKGLWLKIFTEVYQQAETLKGKLLATGTDALVFADLREGPSGIGLAEKDSGVLDPTKWKGENAVGVAQETVRARMREGALADKPAAEAKESVITEEEQNKAKVGAIVNNFRNRG